jgi:hypothetical protein
MLARTSKYPDAERVLRFLQTNKGGTAGYPVPYGRGFSLTVKSFRQKEWAVSANSGGTAKNLRPGKSEGFVVL